MSNIEAERQIRDKDKTIVAYRTQVNAIRALTEETVGEVPKKGGLTKLIENFEIMMGASKEERETYYGDKIRDYATGRINTDRKEGAVTKPDYAAVIADVEGGLDTLEIRPEDKTRIITALKTKYNV